VATRERRDIEQPVGCAGNAERQEATAEEADGKKPATPCRRYGARHDVVIGNGDDAADEGIHGPQHEEGTNDNRPRQRSQRHHQESDAEEAADSAEGAGHVERQTAPTALREVGDKELRGEPAVARDRRSGADRDGAAGETVHQRGDNGAGIDRCRAALEADAGGGDAPEAPPGLKPAHCSEPRGS